MVTKAKNVKWQNPSIFNISLTGPGTKISGLDSIEPEILSMACTGIQLADINAHNIEEYIGEEWRFANGRLENYQITVTFKDFDNFKLYRIWASTVQKALRMYPDDQKINLEVYTADSFDIEKYTKIVEFKDCMLTTVSGGTLDNSAIASVSEFSVVLKCSYVITYNDDIANGGIV
jgi:hypothetical protein